MKRSTEIIIRTREAKLWLGKRDDKEARRSRVESYAYEFSERHVDIADLLAKIARSIKKETARSRSPRRSACAD